MAKNLLEDLPGGERRKIRVKMVKKPTGGLLKGEKKKKMVKIACDWNRGGGSIGKISYWRTYQGGKETNKE